MDESDRAGGEEQNNDHDDKDDDGGSGDVFDLFDLVESLQAQSREQGNAEGIELGMMNSFREGEQLGLVYGEKMGAEIGYYCGVIMVWKELLWLTDPTPGASRSDHPLFSHLDLPSIKISNRA